MYCLQSYLHDQPLFYSFPIFLCFNTNSNLQYDTNLKTRITQRKKRCLYSISVLLFLGKEKTLIEILVSLTNYLTLKSYYQKAKLLQKVTMITQIYIFNAEILMRYYRIVLMKSMRLKSSERSGHWIVSAFPI